MTDENLYDRLGVPKDATADAIKQAFRTMAKRLHPDKPGGDAARFTSIQIAYDTLKDERKRAYYDATGKTAETAGDPIEEQARGILGIIITAFLDRDDLLSINLAGFVKEGLDFKRNEITQAEQAASHMRDKAARLRKARSKLKSPKAEALVVSIMERAIERIETDAKRLDAEAKEHLAIIKRAEAIYQSGEYTYEADPPRPVDPYSAYRAGGNYNSPLDLNNIFETILKQQQGRK